MSDQPTRTLGRRRRSRPAQLDDAAWLREQYVVLGRTMQNIAAELGCNHWTVRNALRRHGIDARPAGGSARRFPRLDDADWLREQYVVLGRTTANIATGLGCSVATVTQARWRHGITIRGAHYAQLDDADWLREQYVVRGRSMQNIADELGCTATTVLNALRRHGIDARARRPRAPATPHAFPRLYDAAWLREQYVVRGRTIANIAAELDCGEHAVANALRRHGIPRRDSGKPRVSRLDDAAWLREQYIVLGRSAPDIAAELGCARETVSNALRRHGITIRVQERPAQLDDADWLREQYVERRRTSTDIAAELGCSTSVVLNALRRHSITIRGGHPAQLDDADWLREQYVVRGRPSTDIAAELGCSPGMVSDALRRHGITMRRGGQRPHDPMRPTALYVLARPDGRPIYVGQSVNIDARIGQHWRHHEDWRSTWADLPAPPAAAWAVITTVPAVIANVEEARLIASLAEHGEPLTNVSRRAPRWDDA